MLAIMNSRGIQVPEMEDHFIDVAPGVSKKTDVCALRLHPSSPEFRKLKSFFKDMFISFENMKLRTSIVDIIPRAGYYEFKQDMSSRGMTVQYGLVLDAYLALMRNTVAKHIIFI